MEDNQHSFTYVPINVLYAICYPSRLTLNMNILVYYMYMQYHEYWYVLGSLTLESIVM